MGQYKVPQNVESEDKIIGPLTFKQFIYALIGLGWGGLSFALLHSFIPIMIVVGAPVTLLFLLLAFYSRDGQNFEQLLIALVGFFSQSRRRVWRKEEIVESFKIQPKPAVVEQSQRNPNEVRSELERLGNLIDSRGWNRPQDEVEMLEAMVPVTNDRLVMPAETAPAPKTEEVPAADIMDLGHSPLAQNLASLLETAASDVRKEAIEQMSQNPKAAEQPAVEPVSTSVTSPSTGDILKLATERDDLTVSQLAATATRMAPLVPGQSVELRTNGTSTK